MKSPKSKYTDLFLDFDDTLYDTHGNAVIALRETFGHFRLDRWFPDPQVFYDAYWSANIDLWTRYSRGEISREFLIVERFRQPLSACHPAPDRPSPPWAVSPQPPAASSRPKAASPRPSAASMAGETFCLEINSFFLDRCSEKSGVVEGARELMDYLKSKGYRMHVTSNGFHEVQYKKLASCRLRDYFTTVILSEDAGANKPSKAFFDYALHRAQASPATTLMIGDNLETDILGALRAGLDAMLFNRWSVPADQCPLSPTFVVDRLLDIRQIL